MKLYLYAGILAALVVAFGLFGWRMHHSGYAAGEAVGNTKVATLTAQYAQATAKAEVDARAREQASAKQMAAIDAQHAQELQHAKQDADAVIADLRAGSLRLRKQWRGCEATASVPGVAASAGQPDAAAYERSQGASDLVRLAATADAKIRALQVVVKADRQ